ncbi:MAG: thermonuclease family protein [Candidatus Woesebacteria bacterium]
MQSQVLGEDDERGYEQALVEEVIDGDTIRLSDGRKVRYIGVDTPETKDPRVGQECFGKEASEHNRQLVEGKIVSLEKDVSETDRYGRLLRYVWLEDVLVNKLLVEEGYAFARSFPPDIAKQDELKEAERQAREKQLGLWGVCELNDVDKINELIKAADETSQD